MELRPGDIVDRYQITAKVGSGGMATVWKARHLDLGTLHAIKVLHVSGPSLIQRLRREGQIQSSIRHPNVVGVTEVIEVEGAPALVLEWIEGFPLDRVLARFQLDATEIDDLMAGIFAGLVEVERLGLIHRDLKPGNILLAVEGERLIPKVVDFGIATVLNDARELEHQADPPMGTPGYMALEQYRDPRNVDGRADVFSLGAILYELVAGRPAFGGRDLVEIIVQMSQRTWRPLHEVAPWLDARRAGVIEVALSPHPNDRHPTVEAMREAWFPAGPPPLARWDDLLASAQSVLAPLAGTIGPPGGGTPEASADPKPPAQPFEAPWTPGPAAPPRWRLAGPRTARAWAPARVAAALVVAAVVGSLGVANLVLWQQSAALRTDEPAAAPRVRPRPDVEVRGRMVIEGSKTGIPRSGTRNEPESTEPRGAGSRTTPAP